MAGGSMPANAAAVRSGLVAVGLALGIVALLVALSLERPLGVQ
jgi:hypothetical protein